VLGYVVSIKGIEANLDKIEAIVYKKHPHYKKEVQRLTSRIAALNQFMAKLAEQSLPFFKVLRGSGTFEWGMDPQEPFNAMKNIHRSCQHW
jgi:hypothetical protein